MNLYKPCSTMTVNLIKYIQENPNTIYHMNQFLSKYQNAIFNFVKLIIKDYHNSMDLTNKILLTLSKKVKEVKIKKAFNKLTLKIIRGEINNYWRKQNSEKAKLLRQATIIHNNEEVSLFNVLQGEEGTAEEILNLLVIRDMIENSTEENLKKIFLLKYRDGESIDKISEYLGLTTYQVKKHLQDIKLSVKKSIEEIQPWNRII